MSKTVSTRVDNRIHKDLMERCNRLGCNLNEFVGESIKFMLYSESDFEFDTEENESQDVPEESIQQSIPQTIKANNVRIIQD